MAGRRAWNAMSESDKRAAWQHLNGATFCRVFEWRRHGYAWNSCGSRGWRWAVTKLISVSPRSRWRIRVSLAWRKISHRTDVVIDNVKLQTCSHSTDDAHHDSFHSRSRRFHLLFFLPSSFLYIASVVFLVHLISNLLSRTVILKLVLWTNMMLEWSCVALLQVSRQGSCYWCRSCGCSVLLPHNLSLSLALVPS